MYLHYAVCAHGLAMINGFLCTLFLFSFSRAYPLLFSVLFHFCEHNPTASTTIKLRCLYICFDNSETIIKGLLITLLTDGVNVNQYAWPSTIF